MQLMTPLMIRLYNLHESQTTRNQYFNYCLINFVISFMKHHKNEQHSMNLSYTSVLITYNHLFNWFIFGWGLYCFPVGQPAISSMLGTPHSATLNCAVCCFQAKPTQSCTLLRNKLKTCNRSVGSRKWRSIYEDTLCIFSAIFGFDLKTTYYIRHVQPYRAKLTWLISIRLGIVYVHCILWSHFACGLVSCNLGA
jgi:hypothetical protein